MNSLRDVFETVEQQRKTLEVYTADETIASEIASQFRTRNVRVVREHLAPGDQAGFVIIRSADGEFRGALGIKHFRALLSPDIHPPWELTDTESDFAEVFDFLDNTLFASFDKPQMLATAREIEERAWRAADGTLFAGFQRRQAFTKQTDVYTTLGEQTSLSIKVFIEDDWTGSALPDTVDVVTASDDEIGAFWLVMFDSGKSELETVGLVAEERDPDEYYGFWTYDPMVVDSIMGYLETEYGGSGEDTGGGVE